MKKGTILGNIWDVKCESVIVKYYGCDIPEMVLYMDDTDSVGYWLLAVDAYDRVYISGWTNGEPSRWVNVEETLQYMTNNVGTILFNKYSVYQGIA